MRQTYTGLLLLICLACAPTCAARQSSGQVQTTFQSEDRTGVVDGAWAAEFRLDTGAVHLMIERRVGAQGSDKRFFQLSLYRLAGLSQTLPLQNGSELKFQLARDAGTFLFAGVFQNGNGSGRYQFTADPAFIADMKELGYDEVTPETQFFMAVHDISIDLIKELRRLKGGHVPLDELVSIGRQGVNSDYIRAMKTAGLEPQTEKQLAEMRRHGVSETFIRELEALGYERPSVEELINLRRQAVSVAFIKELEAMGYKHIPLAKLADMKFQGVTIEFIKELEAMGYGRPAINDLLGMKFFGVTPAFIRAVEAAGHRGVPINLLTCMRIHGLNADFVKRATDGGSKKISLRELVRLHNPGPSRGSCELHVFPDSLPQ